MADFRRCRDDGRCWHGCGDGSCWREEHCGPLSSYVGPWGNLSALEYASVRAVLAAKGHDSDYALRCWQELVDLVQSDMSTTRKEQAATLPEERAQP